MGGLWQGVEGHHHPNVQASPPAGCVWVLAWATGNVILKLIWKTEDRLVQLTGMWNRTAGPPLACKGCCPQGYRLEDFHNRIFFIRVWRLEVHD